MNDEHDIDDLLNELGSEGPTEGDGTIGSASGMQERAERPDTAVDQSAHDRALEDSVDDVLASIGPPLVEHAQVEPPAGEELLEEEARKPAAAGLSVAPMEESELAELNKEKNSGKGMLWFGVMAAVVGFVAMLIWTQTDVFHPERAREKAAERERDKAASLKEHLDKQDKAGAVVLRADEGGAALWLYLGRTPAQSMKLPSDRVHEIRVESEGHVGVDLRVAAQHWAGSAGQRQAKLAVTLKSGARELPAYPPEPEQEIPAGGPGHGVVHVESTPPGADAWLLVGFTPEATVNLVAGKPYRFRLLKRGFEPAEIKILEDDWWLSSPQGPMKDRLRRHVTLKKRAGHKGKRRP